MNYYDSGYTLSDIFWGLILLIGLLLFVLYRSKKKKQSFGGSLFDTTYKSNIGTYFLLAFATYTVFLAILVGKWITPTAELYQLYGLIAGLILYGLFLFLANWIHQDAIRRNITSGAWWAIGTILAPITIVFYLIKRKRHPVVKSKLKQKINWLGIFLGTIVWLIFTAATTYFIIYVYNSFNTPRVNLPEF